MVDIKYLSGGEQTTINSTITELFTALAFNTNTNIQTADQMQEFISKINLNDNGARKSFVNSGNIESAEEYITQMGRIRPNTKQTKLENAVGIYNWIKQYNKDRTIDKVVWGYREKPQGVPNNHAGDIFLVFKNKKVSPKVVGISLKAGTKSSKEPKLNSYVGTTLRKSMWQKAYPNALKELSDQLWDEVYSKIPNVPKSVDKNNYLTLTSSRQTPNKIIQECLKHCM